MTRRFRVVAALSLLAFALSALPARASQVIEFYNEALDHYFITNNANEISDLDSGVHRGWVRTGHRFEVFDAGDPRLANSTPVCRFYGNPARGLDSHFYSATPQECTDVQVRFPDAWFLESTDVFRVQNPETSGTCPATTMPVHRLYNVRSDVNHRYTTDRAVVTAMLAKGYVLEGVGGSGLPVVFCVIDTRPPPPLCNISASTTAPDTGTTLTLVATCSNAPTSYQWTNCTSSTATCTTTQSSPGARSYSVTATNLTGTSPPASVVVTWRLPVTSPPVCTLSSSPANPYAGSTATLTATCTQSAASYVWVNCPSPAANTCQVTSPVPAAVTYSVTGRNSFGSSAPASITLNWPTPPPGGADFCGSFAKVMHVNLVWGGFVDTNDPGGGYEDDMVLVGRLTVPANASGTTNRGVISVVEHVDPPTQRIVSVSRSACDFRGFVPGNFPSTDPSGTSQPLAWAFGINPSVNYALSTMQGAPPKLVPGETYYINIRNADYTTGNPTCGTPECNVRVTVTTPR